MSLRVGFLVCALAALMGGCAHNIQPPPYAESGLGARTVVVDEAPRPEPASWKPVVVKAHVVEGPAPVSRTVLGGPQAVADSDGPYLLDTGDELRVFIYGHPNLSRLYKVDHSGLVTIPLIGNVGARGLTAYAVQRKIKRKLGARYIRNPHVTVDIHRNRPFFILGEVRNPGAFPYVNGMTIQTAAAIAGGYSERANMGRMRLSRRVNGLVETMEVPPDYVVLPGDTVYVFERFF